MTAFTRRNKSSVSELIQSISDIIFENLLLPANQNLAIIMPLSYRIVCSCLLALFFFIMMAVKLDRKPDWNWFLVCLPLWIFNLFFSVLLIIRLVSHLRNGRERDTNAMSLFSKGLFIFVLLMKWIFEIMLCIKLQYVDGGGKKLSMFFCFYSSVDTPFDSSGQTLSLDTRSHVPH